MNKIASALIAATTLAVCVAVSLCGACGSSTTIPSGRSGAAADLGQPFTRECFGANDCLPGQICNQFGVCVTPTGGGGNAAPPDFGLPPEVENRVEPPASGKRFVYVAVASQGTVVKIDSQSLQVRTVPIGKQPASLRTVPGQDVAIVLDRGSDTVTILESQNDDSDKVLTFPTAPGVNSIAMSPDGHYAVAFFDLLASGGVLSDKQTFQEVTVVHLEVGQESAVNLSVGFRPSEVRFPPDGKVAWVVTDQGVSTISLAAPPKPAIVPTVPLVRDPIAEPPPTGVRFTSDGKYALCRVAGYKGFRAVALPGGAITDVPLAGEPSALELTPDGKWALAVLRDEKLLAFAALPGDLAAPGNIAVASTGSYVGGQVVVSGDSAHALLFTNAVSQKVMLVADVAQRTVKALPLSKAVRSAVLAPDGRTAIVVHNKAPGTPQPSDPLDVYLDKLHGYSLFEVQSGFAKLQPGETDPGPIAFAPDGTSAYVLLASAAPLVRAVEAVDLQSFLVSRVTLGSLPVAAGVVPATKQIYVAQSHPLGRMTFIDAGSFKTRTLTGFALNGGIIE